MMCGICGIAFAQRDAVLDPETIRRMTGTIKHRGSDDEGFYVKPGVQMGVRRLSIVGLKTGNQPISSEDGSITLVCNGEIYNFIELREQLEGKASLPVEVRCRSHCSSVRGVRRGCLDWLRGMFAFALWDEKKRQLTGAAIFKKCRGRRIGRYQR